jgi:hypothetical protein
MASSATAKRGQEIRHRISGRRTPQTMDLPIENYPHLRIDEIIAQANFLSPEDIRKLMSFEKKNKKRQTLLSKLKRRMH